ncbi:MAG TPA: hypothetical protein VNR51_01180 [Hyphomicrobium sp.]|nr:hypothetical protein [Hyphomicrobium sp.]
MDYLILNIGWFLLGAFATGFVLAWIVCGEEKSNSTAAVAAAGAAAVATSAREDEKRRGIFAWLWRGYRTYDRGAGWWDRIAWLLGLFKTNAGTAVLVAATGAAATYGAALIHDRYITPPSEVETAAIEPEVRQTTNSTVFAIEGNDRAGRHGAFDVVVLNKSFLWVRGSAEDLEKDGQVLPRAELANAVLDDEVRAALTDTREVIAVGTASQEGVATEEMARAERRAKQTAALIAGAIGPEVPIYTLNLGQYRDMCTDCETGGTSWQRPFIVIGVKSADPDTNIGEALADAMTGKERLPSPASYSAFELARFR